MAISDAEDLNATNKKGVSYSNPLQDENEYSFLNNCFNGSGGFFDNSYIFPHVREEEYRYYRRKVQAYYLNLFKPLVNANTLPLFKIEPARTYTENNQAKTMIQMFLDDCDLKGNSLNTFMKHSLQRGHIDGVAYILVDNFSEVPKDVKSTLENRAIPYLTIIKAGNLVDFELDDHGRLISFTYFHSFRKDENGETDFNDPIHKRITNYYFVDVEITKVLETNLKDGVRPDVREIEETRVENKIGVIPIVPINTVDVYKFLPYSNFYNIGRMGYRLFNLISEQQEQESNTMYPILAKPSDGSPNRLVTGTGNGLTYDKDASPPSYISPDVAPIQVLQSSEKLLIEKMFVSANMTFMTDSSNVSAEAKKWAFERTSTALNEFSLMMEDAEKKIFALFDMYLNIDSEFQVKYNRKFGILDVEQELAQVIELLSIENLGEKGKAEIVKDFIDNYFSFSSNEFIEALKDSIDDAVIVARNITNDSDIDEENEELEG